MKRSLILVLSMFLTFIVAPATQANGQGIKGVFPALDGSPIATVKSRITEHIRQVIYGKNNMPAFGEQLSDTDIAAVVTYERNTWGNKTGDIIQPKDVAESRKK